MAERYLDMARGVLAMQGRRGLPLLRVGVGLLLLLAGLHKLVAPEVWSAYYAPLFLSLDPTGIAGSAAAMQAGGVGEIAFGLLILADKYTSIVAALAALSLAAVVVNLAVMALQTGEAVDVLIRDVGLTVMAAALALLSAQEEIRRGDAF
jgi:uncharacterized membrane protein YphA (DoxX/SURF4 family)